MSETYEVYAVRFATNPARLRGHNFIADPNPLQPNVMDFYCWILVGGGEAIMVDVGTKPDIVEKHGYQLIGSPMEALTALGFEAASVRTVILTHLHFDHIGNIDQFPAAQFHVPQAEMQFATGPDMRHYYLRRAYSPKDLGTVIDYLHQERVTLHGKVHEVAPGVTVHVTGGHTAGQAAVRVRTQRGWMVLASDVAHYYEELERGIPFSLAHNISAMLAAHGTIRSLAESDAHIIPAHDPLVMERYPAAKPDLAGFVARLDVTPRV